jgi:hypothetical protein
MSDRDDHEVARARITALEAEVERLEVENVRLRAAARDKPLPRVRLLRRSLPGGMVWAISIALLGGGWLMATGLLLASR